MNKIKAIKLVETNIKDIISILNESEEVLRGRLINMVIDKISEKYCIYCGSTDKYCQCRNDE